MKANSVWIPTLVCVLSGLLAQSARAAEFVGSWTLAPSEKSGQVQFGLMHNHRGGDSQHRGDWPVSAFQGLDVTARGRQDVKFAVVRDAGRIDCEGYLKDGKGAGEFVFAANRDFRETLGKLGFGGIDDERQFAMAMFDVSIEFVRAMQAERLEGLDTDQLIAFRIFGVDSKFIQDLRREGLAADDAGKLVAFKVHGVTPEYMHSIEKLGFGRPDADQLVAMRVHGVTPQYIEKMKARGVKNLTLDKFVQLKVHGIE